MILNQALFCGSFPCAGVRHDRFTVPGPFDPAGVVIVLISECPPLDPADGYDAPGEPLFARTTVQAFRDAGADVQTLADVRALGVYLTTAVKCAKTQYAIAREAILNCAPLLERELAPFGNVRAYLLMGDVAIRAFNAVARLRGEPRVIPAGATYKIRDGRFTYRGARVFPSYLQAGPSFFIEKSKRQVITEDIAAALAIIAQPGIVAV